MFTILLQSHNKIPLIAPNSHTSHPQLPGKLGAKPAGAVEPGGSWSIRVSGATLAPWQNSKQHSSRERESQMLDPAHGLESEAPWSTIPLPTHCRVTNTASTASWGPIGDQAGCERELSGCFLVPYRHTLIYTMSFASIDLLSQRAPISGLAAGSNPSLCPSSERTASAVPLEGMQRSRLNSPGVFTVSHA